MLITPLDMLTSLGIAMNDIDPHTTHTQHTHSAHTARTQHTKHTKRSRGKKVIELHSRDESVFTRYQSISSLKELVNYSLVNYSLGCEVLF